MRTCQKLNSHASSTPKHGPFLTVSASSSSPATYTPGSASKRAETLVFLPSGSPSGLASNGTTTRRDLPASSASRPQATGQPTSPPRSGQNFTAVVGVPRKIVERRPIDVLQRDYPDVFNLLILAFESIQKRGDSEDLGYYQLSGMKSLRQSRPTGRLTSSVRHSWISFHLLAISPDHSSPSTRLLHSRERNFHHMAPPVCAFARGMCGFGRSTRVGL